MTIVCNCETGGVCQIHPKPRPVPVPSPSPAPPPIVPTLAAEDKLTLKTLEAESLKSQIEMERQRQQLMLKAQMAYQQLEQFTAAMFEKHGLKQSEWTLDLSRLEFVQRESPKQG